MYAAEKRKILSAFQGLNPSHPVHGLVTALIKLSKLPTTKTQQEKLVNLKWTYAKIICL
jgi:hypothetical protein